jgi:hypothetical protein
MHRLIFLLLRLLEELRDPRIEPAHAERGGGECTGPRDIRGSKKRPSTALRTRRSNEATQ